MSLSDHLLGPLADEGGKKLAEGIKTLFGTTNNERISAEGGFYPSAYLGAAQTQQNGLALREHILSTREYDVGQRELRVAAREAVSISQLWAERAKGAAFGIVGTLGVVFFFSLFGRKSA